MDAQPPTAPDGAPTPAPVPAPVDDRERGYWVAFNRTPGVGAARVRRLLRRFGTLGEAWQASRHHLGLAGLDRRSLDAVDALRRVFDPPRELARLRRLGARAVVWTDAEYPALLAAITDSPPVLYVKGSLAPEDGQAVAIVGTRRPTGYGRDVAERLAHDLAQAGLTVVSGMAKGIDSHAHRAALRAGGRTVAVLGHGIDTCYPPENRELAVEIAARGAVVTDYPLGTGPQAENFPARNRIISGLASAVLVVEAGETSGALITSRYAGEQGRDVFAVPGPITSPASLGCHRLIQDGARLVTSAADVLGELNPHLAAVTATQLSFDWGVTGGPRLPAAAPADDPLLRHLADAGQPVHVDELSRLLGRPVQEVSGSMALLEIQGRVRHLGSMRYELVH